MKGSSRYLRLERRIASGEHGDVVARWRYGRELIAAKAGRKQLPHGMIGDLVAAAAKAGIKGVSEREIRYRLQCAEAYRTEAEVGTACADFGSWSALRDAGFPPVQADGSDADDIETEGLSAAPDEWRPAPCGHRGDPIVKLPALLAALLLAALALAGCTTAPGPGPAGGSAVHTITPVDGIVPVALAIPSLAVAADVIPIGLDKAGKVAVPDVHTQLDMAGWVDIGPRPGQPGRAMVAAHVNGGGQPGPFAELATIKPGAQILLTDKAGTSLTFVVDSTAQAAKTAFPADLFGDTGKRELVLTTCGGELDQTAHSYRDNILVRAHLQGA